MKVLIIEDEAEMLNNITAYFAKSGFVCEIATTHQQAEEKINLYNYDCILLDINLPDGNGLNILEQLKEKKSKAGIIVISAKDSLEDKVAGLNLGADDYLPKPFHLTELNARVNAIVRRLKFEGANQIELDNILIQPENQKVFIGGIEITLTKKEYELLLFFISNKERIISKNSLAEHIWGDNSDQSDTYHFIYSQIKNLKRKLHEKGSRYNIQAIYGLGYKFISHESA
jgi:DNA-binding response OmpR family regulator